MWQCCPSNNYQVNPSQQITIPQQNIYYQLVPKYQSLQNIKIQRGSKIIVTKKSYPIKFTPQQIYTKYSGDDYDKILTQLKKKKTVFIDPNFPHLIQSLTLLNQNYNISWKRIQQIDQKCKTNMLLNQNVSIQAINNFNTDNKSLKNVLLFLSLKQLLQKNPIILQYNNLGLYAFKIKSKYKPMIIVVDDYLPLYKNKLIYSQPIKNDFYLPLLQKALAKAYKNYEAIPNNQDQLFDTISCLPYANYWIKNNTKQTLKYILTHIGYFNVWKLENEFMEVRLMQKNTIKLNPVFNGDNLNTIQMNMGQFLQKCQSISMWVLDQEFNSLFVDFNKKEVLIRLDIKKYSQILLSYNSDNQGRNKLLIVDQHYNYIKSNFMANSKNNSIYLPNISSGIYYIYCQRELKSQGVISVHAPVVFNLNEMELQDRFLEIFLLKYASSKNKGLNKYLINEKSSSYVTMRLLYEQLGIGFVVVSLQQEYRNKIKIEFNNEQIKKCGYHVANYGQQKYVKILRGKVDLVLIKNDKISTFHFNIIN